MSYIDYMQTPIGWLEIGASDTGISHIVFVDVMEQAVIPSALIDLCKQQLTEYFEGSRTQFDIALDTQGTDFQQSVWQCLLEISYGELASYQEIAVKIHNPKAVRAVGAANGRNPVSIIVPCHRVIGSNGTLTGYAGGLERKSWLLEHEANYSSQSSPV